MLAQIEAMVALHHLAVLGGFAAGPDDGLPKGTKTLLLLGPLEPGFWPHLKTTPEWGNFQKDLADDPVDHWSRRVIGTMACDLGAKALFPFGGPPYHPFYKWALKSGRCWDSPVRLLVHDVAGLFVSFRGALALKQDLTLPPVPPRPCDICPKPCVTACPVGALTGAGYDLATCHAYLDTPPGADCMANGCAVRRACPLSLAYARMPEQSAYHMGQFHK